MLSFELNISDDTNLTVVAILPQAGLQEAERFQPDFADLVESAQFATLDQVDDQARLSIDLPVIGRRRSDHLRTSDLVVVRDLLRAVTLAGTVTSTENDLDIFMGDEASRYRDGRMPMSVEFEWPEASDEQISAVGTRYMHLAARSIKYAKSTSGRLLDYFGMVYAQAERERGVTLQTNPMGSCAVETTGFDFSPGEDRPRLTSHNIYNAEQQILCAVGGIDISRADDLLE